MSTKTKIVAAGLAASLALGGIGAASAGAATAGSGPRAEAQDRTAEPGRRQRAVRRIVRVAAEAIGIEPRALAGRVRAGESIAAVAQAEGVERQAVVDALVAAGEERIAAAVEAGRLTEERAATARERLPDAAGRIVDRVRQPR